MTEKHRVEDYLNYLGAQVPQEGHGWKKIRCPFHGDSHASAAINFKENRYKCFACPASGDIYDLIMYREGGTYIEALKFAETVSTTSNPAVRSSNRPGNRVSRNQGSIGRRGRALSTGGSD